MAYGRSGNPGVVEAAIQRASESTGVDFSFLMRTANRESSMNPRAKAPRPRPRASSSSSSRPGCRLKQHGAKYGYARYADLITKGSDGRYRRQRRLKRARPVMDLRSRSARRLADGRGSWRPTTPPI